MPSRTDAQVEILQEVAGRIMEVAQNPLGVLHPLAVQGLDAAAAIVLSRLAVLKGYSPDEQIKGQVSIEDLL